ncbi:MAG: NAD(P)-dependent oxidoreductase [Planctomycetota bacterium]|jgi:D-3-phosphoglycerate dehydrogenase
MSTATTKPDTATAAGAPAGLHVLIADKFEASGIAAMENLGCRVTSDPDLSAETLPAAVAEANPEVLVVRSTKVLAPVFEHADHLNLIVRAGAGYDNIDVETASRNGIFVANCPGKNAIAVAELAWGLILSCDRRIPDQVIDLRSGKWDKKGYGKAKGLFGRTLGIVGIGRIGQEVARRGMAFGMKVNAWSRSLTEERADELGVGFCSSLINLAKMSDVVSVNVAATEETKHLIDDGFCQAMKEGAILINTSRGSVVDGEAVARVIREKGVRAGLDVYGRQPAAGDTTFADPIAEEPIVYGTHHCGASTDQAQQAIAAETARIIEVYQQTGNVPNCVNRAASTPATSLLTVRHLNRPGVLAHVFYTLGQAGINVEEMENVIYEGHAAACARIQLDGAPSDEHVKAIGSNENVLSIDVAKI